jgi:hypothetical protein
MPSTVEPSTWSKLTGENAKWPPLPSRPPQPRTGSTDGSSGVHPQDLPPRASERLARSADGCRESQMTPPTFPSKAASWRVFDGRVEQHHALARALTLNIWETHRYGSPLLRRDLRRRASAVDVLLGFRRVVPNSERLGVSRALAAADHPADGNATFLGRLR